MKLHRIKILLVLSMGFIFHTNLAQANCKDPELRQNVTQTAKAEGINENELLSIIAHESRCNYYTIAWNLPGKAQTAKSKFLDSLEEAKALAESLIATGQYRVDVGIGQINNEAHIKPKGWALEEVLNPNTALIRVAQVLKERGWTNYHSSNPTLAKKWQGMALAALDQALGNSKTIPKYFSHNLKEKRELKGLDPLVVFNSFVSSPATLVKQAKLVQKRAESPLLIFLN